MQPHYTMGDMMFDPLPMNNGMYHQPPPVGSHLMHQQHAGQRTGGLQSLGLLHQQMVGPEDDLDDLMSALDGDPVVLGGQQQQHLGQMHNHVYDQSHLIPPRSQAQEPHLQAGRTQGMPLTGQAPSMQQQGEIPGAMHLNQMSSNGVGVGWLPWEARPQRRLLDVAGPHTPPPWPPSAIVPSAASFPKASTTSSRALATSSNNGGSSDEDNGMGEDDTVKKKERRRQQVRYASRRRRKKQKDDESFLRDRIAELKEQIRIIGGDLTEQCSQMAGMSEQALTEAYEKQMLTVQTLRKDNNMLKEKLLQHENFARMIQYGLNALPSDCRDVDRKKIAGVPMWISDQMNPLRALRWWWASTCATRLCKVTDDIVVVHRISSVASDLSDREFISVAFRFCDGENYFIGLKSITVQTECAENCIRGEECQGWMFIGGEKETSQWKAHFLGYYDVKGEKDDKVLNEHGQ
ncbi:hypothetical protein BBJ28_00020232 [Nothophytophthora sp. Chile5]|nr:hypothetical protein BBJ28_00020232 [Nothophytophthora sp. Chile5]